MDFNIHLLIPALCLIPFSLFSQILDSIAIGGSSMDVDVYGNFFVVDASRNILTLFSREGKQVRQVGGQGWGSDQFDRPLGVWSRNGLDVFVADYGNHRIQRFDRTLSFVSSLFTHEDPISERRFGYPTDAALSRLGSLFICDSENSRIMKLSMLNEIEKNFGGYDAGAGRLASPTQIEIGPADHLYVLDRNRVVVFDIFGNYLGELGSGLFRRPSSLHADEETVVILDGSLLYVFDAEERPQAAIDLSVLTGGRVRETEVLAVAFHRNTLYALTASKMYILSGRDLRDSPDSDGQADKNQQQQ